MIISTDKNFFWYWKRSLFAHALIVVLTILANRMNIFDLSPEQVQVLQPSVRVDIVELPKYTLDQFIVTGKQIGRAHV